MTETHIEAIRDGRLLGEVIAERDEGYVVAWEDIGGDGYTKWYPKAGIELAVWHVYDI